MTCFDKDECMVRDVDGLVQSFQRDYRGDYIDCMPFYIEEENYVPGGSRNTDGGEVLEEEATTEAPVPEGDGGIPTWLMGLIAGFVIFVIALVVYFKVKTWKSIRKPKKEDEAKAEEK